MELRGIVDLYKTKLTEEGPVETLFKRNASFRMYCEPQHLGIHAEVLNIRTGKPYKDRCQVFIQDFGVVTIRHTVEEVTRLKREHAQNKTVGFHANKSH
jgi:hypothetical protein